MEQPQNENRLNRRKKSVHFPDDHVIDIEEVASFENSEN